MLNWKAIIFIFFVFVLGNILCMTIEGSWFTDYEQETLTAATAYDVPVQAGIWGTVKTGYRLFTTAIPRALTWNYSFLDGEGYDLMKYILLYPLSAGVVYGLAMAFIGTVSRLWTR